MSFEKQFTELSSQATDVEVGFPGSTLSLSLLLVEFDRDRLNTTCLHTYD